jgi:hypothetical protein
MAMIGAIIAVAKGEDGRWVRVQYNTNGTDGERWRSDGEMMTRFEFWTTVVLVMAIRNCHVLEPPRAFFMSIQFIGCTVLYVCMALWTSNTPMRPGAQYGIRGTRRRRGVSTDSLH